MNNNSRTMKIDLGCGSYKSDGFIGVDIFPAPGVDVIADLNKKFPFADSTIDEIKAHDIIEHLPDRLHTMNEIWRVCKNGAIVNIRVPSTDGRGAFQDPTHVSFWNINSFFYYCNQFPPYLKLCRTYGFKGEFEIIQLEHEKSPNEIIHVIAKLKVIKPVSKIDQNNRLVTNNPNENLSFLIESNKHLQLIFSSSPKFSKINDAINYQKHLLTSINYIYQEIISNPNSQEWNQIVEYFCQNFCFIPAYFNEENLKDIYVKRGEIIKFYLISKGYQIDYDFIEAPIKRKKIRLGILVNHFNPSAETFASLPVYEYLSRDFEVILYSLSQTNHSLEQYCKLSANAFRLLPNNLNDRVSVIRKDDLDILYVATNITAVTNQICLLSTHRIARIQVTSGASVVTTGIENIDYFISGTLTDPSPNAQDHYTEKLIQIEGTSHCFSYGNEEGKITSSLNRNELGIAEDDIVFISGANYFKIIPELIETWTKIISQVPNSVLVLLPFGPNWAREYPKAEFITHLQSFFTHYNLNHNRLIVLDPQPTPDREQLKEYYKIADVYLDSFPFSGTTSLIEPLQVSLPIVTRQGDYFRSAMGSAIIKSLNIPDLVADSEESYIKLAVNLGNNGHLRQQKSLEIQEKMSNNPSFLDSKFYALKIETLFKELIRNYAPKTLIPNLNLSKINYLIFPNWQSDEQTLTEELYNLIYKLAKNSLLSDSPLIKGGWGGSNLGGEGITLVIDTTGITEEDTNLILSGIAMNLMMEEQIDLENTLNFALINNLNQQQWNKLLPQITAKITLENENQDIINQLNIEDLVTINGNGNNYAIFPDWKADQEELALEISQVLMNLSEEENCTLLVNLNNADQEEVGLFFSEVAMNLMLVEGIELDDNINISFVDFTFEQWQSLEVLIKQKIDLPCESLPEQLPNYIENKN